ncbi:S-layer protein domain-containing protein [Methanolobus sp. ZRKC3]|uniref:S-layer protein domain-containing protein n=1 Tax=Methanolobus sp. ZRKC3 TaxID=3125786 RepID=UPI003249B66E
MKRFTAIALVALVALAALAMPVSAADSVVIRSTILNGTDFGDILDDSTQTNVDGNIEFNAYNFAGFWADLDDDLASETLTIINGSNVDLDGNTIDEKGLWYNASIVQTGYEAKFANETDAKVNITEFPIIGLFAEPYVSVANDDAGELVKLIIDTDDKYTLRTGSALELPEGYALTAKQIDVEGDKVWMELSKDGEFVEDEVIDVTAGEATWDYDVDVGDQDDVIVFRVLISDVFQGQVDSLAVIEGLWLIDYENILEVESSDEFGELEVSAVGKTIEMFNSGTLTLSQDKTVDLAEGMFFQTADDENNLLRFYVAKEYTEPGTYVIRGNIVKAGGDFTWGAYEFAAFWADLDDNLASEELNILTAIDDTNRGIPEKGLWYNASIVQTGYEAKFANETDAKVNITEFPIIGLFAEPYVSVANDDAGELVKLIIDTDDKYTLRTGSALELPEGYALTAKQIDVEGDKVWMELSKDGEFVEDEVIDVTAGDATWDYDVDVGDQDDVIVFRVLITDVFQGQVDSLAVVEGLWLIDYENILEIDSSDEFGELEVSAVGKTIEMFNSGTLTLSDDKTVDIAEGMQFQTADDENNLLRFYPFVERTIGEDAVEIVDGEPTDEEMPVDEEAPVVDEEAPVVDEEAPVVDEEAPVVDEEAPVDEEGEEEPAPGFEAIFAVAGLLAVAYLVRRN